MIRSHNLGELRLCDIGRNVTVAGWLESVRDIGSVAFAVLRDHYGVTQIVTSDENILKQIRAIPTESVVQVTGIVEKRQSPNPKLPTGEIEVRPTKPINILGKCSAELPFIVQESRNNKEETRLKYRYLDLRNNANHANIILRSSVIESIRRHMRSGGFLEIQTPILTNSSPEGARDYIVPSRVHPGRFYALPQAPQQYKQLLMVSGFDKYFQIAPCFRDEDARADRSPGEFYQLDMEMAFAEQDDVFAAIEPVMYAVFSEHSNAAITKPPFPRIKYIDALNDFGTDKPDLRNPLRIADVTDIFAAASVPPFFQGKNIRAIAVKEFTKTRKFFDELSLTIKEAGGANAYWARVDANGLTGGVSNALTDDAKTALISRLGLVNGSAVVMVAEEKRFAIKLAGQLRTIMGERLGLIESGKFEFCWIVDFPMFELDEETGKIEFSHNPFSMPQGGLDALNTMNPLDIYAYQYDIVCNGIELSSGAVRNHDPETMIKAFDIAGYSAEEVGRRFPALFNAFKYGAPPHAGVAPGVDRIIMLLAGEANIREVIAFPMNKNAQEPLMGSPGEVTEKQLKETHISIVRSPEER